MTWSNLNVVLRTASQILFEGEALSVALRIGDGVIDLLPGKVSYFTSFDRCVLCIRTVDTSTDFQLGKGVASFERNRLTVVAERLDPHADALEPTLLAVDV